VVEALCRYAQEDLVVPADAWATEVDANDACRAWCDEVNEAVHSEAAAVPAQRLVEERALFRPLPSLRPPLRRGARRRVDKLCCVRIGSARYSVPRELVGRDVTVIAAEGEVVIEHDGVVVAHHRLVAPGEVSLVDEHYGGPRRGPTRAVKPRSETEQAFLALGPVAEAFVRNAAAAGTTKLASELGAITALQAAWGREALVAALGRAVEFRRFKATDVRSILEAGAGVADVVAEGEHLALGLPAVSSRSLDAYRLEALA
jgi:hemin uptake protein HemP